jgi:hypothetical protein
LDVGTQTHRLDRELGRPEEYCRKSSIIERGKQTDDKWHFRKCRQGYPHDALEGCQSLMQEKNRAFTC